MKTNLEKALCTLREAHNVASTVTADISASGDSGNAGDLMAVLNMIDVSVSRIEEEVLKNGIRIA